MLFLTGQHFHAIDAKSRLTIPSKLRESIDTADEGFGFMAVAGFDGVLYLYTPRTYREMAPQFDARLKTNADIRNYERVAYGTAEHLEVDRLGRILVPEATREQCGLRKEVAVVGVKDHIEVWDRSRWMAFIRDRLAEHDQLAERAMAVAHEATGAAPPTAT